MQKVGVLALQGDFAAHARVLKEIGATPLLVTEKAQFEAIDGLIIPGGESTTMLKLLDYEDLKTTLLEFGQKKPIFGTCAGAILMAAHIESSQQFSFGWMDITIARNAYGRQIDSHIAKIKLESSLSPSSEDDEMQAVFIRAPKIVATGEHVNTLATHEKYPVLVEEGLHLAATFHPELTSDTRIHRYFLQKIHSSSIHHLEHK